MVASTSIAHLTGIRVFNQNEWDTFNDTIGRNDCSIYKLEKSLLKKWPASHPLVSPSRLILSSKEKAVLRANSLEKQIFNRPQSRLIRIRNYHQNDISRHQLPETLCYTGLSSKLLEKLPNKKVLGKYQITNIAPKFLPTKYVLALIQNMNGSLQRHNFPKDWKKSIIILIPRPDENLQQPTIYRPKALLSSLAKNI